MFGFEAWDREDDLSLYKVVSLGEAIFGDPPLEETYFDLEENMTASETDSWISQWLPTTDPLEIDAACNSTTNRVIINENTTLMVPPMSEAFSETAMDFYLDDALYNGDDVLKIAPYMENSYEAYWSLQVRLAH